MNIQGRLMNIIHYNQSVRFFLKITFSGIALLFSIFADLSAQTASQSAPPEMKIQSEEGFSVMWVILGIWFAVSMYLLYIDRKFSSMEKKHKND